MIRTLVAVAAVAVLAGCTTSTSTSTPARSTPASSTSSTPAPSRVSTPAPSPAGPLTRRQAARAYTRIVDPGNRVLDAVNSDVTDRAPWRRFVADSRAWIATLRALDRDLTAIRWPAKVQPYITAMTGTLDPADIGCAQAMIKAGSYAKADLVNYTNQDCQAAGDSTLPDTIRRMLHLPPR
jgi:hypothetical protein